MTMSQDRLRELLMAEEQRRKQQKNPWIWETPRTVYIMDNPRKDLTKVIIWRLISIPISIITTYLFTGKADLSLSLTFVLTFVLTTIQFFYEKLWRHISMNNI